MSAQNSPNPASQISDEDRQKEQKIIDERVKALITSDLNQSESRNWILIIILTIVVLLIIGGCYWYFFRRNPDAPKMRKVPVASPKITINSE